MDATLSPTGGLHATVTERSCGQAARGERALRRGSSRRDYQSVLEEWLTAQGGNVVIGSWSSNEDSMTGRYELTVEYDSPTFARNLSGRMLTFRSAPAVSRGASSPAWRRIW